MARECIADMAVEGLQGGQINMGADTHTEFTDDPNAAMNAFLDYMWLMDATAIVRTGSSFSGTIVNIRGMRCKPVKDSVLTPRRFMVCTSRDIC